MTSAAIITLIIILIAVILFITEIISVDLIALLIVVSLVITGVLTPEEGVLGFSNKATITVAFMFILSAALLKTGALQYLAHRLSKIFKYKFDTGLLMMMLLIATISAFINNTPVVAVFIPVVIQIAHNTGQSPSKMLIPLSFASIFGGMCTLIGTSTNILVSGISKNETGLEINMFEMTPIALCLLVVGILYMRFIGIRILPNRKSDENLEDKFKLKNYLTDLEILEESTSVNQKIMDSELVKDYDMDIIEVKRNGSRFNLPQGDFVLQKGDLLKVRCNVEKIKSLKDKTKSIKISPLKLADNNLKGTNSVLVEMVITSSSMIHNKTLRDIDFRRSFRAVPLALKHREELKHDQLYDVTLKSGDIILAEVKTHYIKELKKIEAKEDAPFVLLSENHVTDFNRKKFGIVGGLILAMVILAALNIIDIMVGAISVVVILALTKVLDIKQIYQSVNWKIVFLLAGAISLGTAMQKTGLDLLIADNLISSLGAYGPIALISGLYLATSLLTEMMSNNASAALMAPIAIATAHSANYELMPFLIAVMLAASGTFMTPIGYQTNTMVYSAGQYKFTDFFKVGFGLNLIFWLVASFLIPYYYGMI
ncbi:SLC13 family permease [Psychroflexus halocasei]|uniref:TrkA-C domain-containing protein n=1 Tax=Psychroflexus halocasei TaxID=908615 RepID=A0A1H3ZBI9_9FLAO|nr:SLC13 family permease [Psychroflexus halocasei]SEA20878.1 TrkA-C domain-containing protein [Psychroflexus halocasei]